MRSLHINLYTVLYKYVHIRILYSKNTVHVVHVHSSFMSCFIFPQRAEIVTGAYEPTKEECTWADSDDEGEEESEKQESSKQGQLGYRRGGTCKYVITKDKSP